MIFKMEIEKFAIVVKKINKMFRLFDQIYQLQHKCMDLFTAWRKSSTE